jgi:hypothetical protein
MQIRATSHSLAIMDLLGPILVALIFISLCALLKEPNRRNFNAIMIAGAGAAYFEWRSRHVGVCIHYHCYVDRLQRASILRVHRRWLDITYWLGRCASPLRESHRPVCANLFAGLCNL